MRLSEFDGRFFKVLRDGEFETLGNYTSEPAMEYLSFAESEEYLIRACKKENISCIICPPQLSETEQLLESGKGIAVSEMPKTDFHLFHNWLIRNCAAYCGENPEASVTGDNCRIHETAHIAENGVQIGSNVVIEENVIIRSGVSIGDNVTIHAGAIIGEGNPLIDRDREHNLMTIDSCGKVRIEDDVNIGNYTLVAKGMFPYETTSIGAHTQIGNLIDIAHNSRIGKNSMILDQSQICGNSVLGNDVRVAPHAIVSNRLKIEDHAMVLIGAVVVENVKKGLRVAGNFAIEQSKFLLWHRKKLKK